MISHKKEFFHVPEYFWSRFILFLFIIFIEKSQYLPLKRNSFRFFMRYTNRFSIKYDIVFKRYLIYLFLRYQTIFVKTFFFFLFSTIFKPHQCFTLQRFKRPAQKFLPDLSSVEQNNLLSPISFRIFTPVTGVGV